MSQQQQQQSSSFKSEMTGLTEEEGENFIVTVIGGCGFLGQHLVKQLHLFSNNVSIIRVFDLFIFKQELEYRALKNVHSVIGSVTNMEDLLTATAGATTVFHLASITDRSMFPDEHLHEMVNEEGTKNVITACLENGVKNLIYASDISVVMGIAGIVRGDESSTAYPRYHLQADGPSKAIAEKLVLQACGAECKVDDDVDEERTRTLRTMALRLVNLFGELDSFLLPRLVQLATANNGHIVCVGNLKTKHSMMYVGNAAWAFVCAHNCLCMALKPETSGTKKPSVLSFEPSSSAAVTTTLDVPPKHIKFRSMEEDPENMTGIFYAFQPSVPVEGKVFYICDDTPPANYFVFMKSFMQRYGFFLTSWSLPEKWAKRLAKLAYFVLWLLYPFMSINPPLSVSEVHELCHSYTFSSTMANSQLGYSPFYTFKEALQNTVNFYDKEYKNAMSDCLFKCAIGSGHVSKVRRMSTVKREITNIDLGNSGKRQRRKKGEKWLGSLKK